VIGIRHPAQGHLFRRPHARIKGNDKIRHPKMRTGFAYVIFRFGQMGEKLFAFLKAEWVNPWSAFILQVHSAMRIFVEVLPLKGQVEHLPDAQQNNIHASWT